jgi:hypothetical protein
MKKILLLAFGMCAVLHTKAQLTIANGTTQYIVPDNVTPVEAHLDVINNNSTTIDVDVYRTIEALTPGHIEAFCFGLYCYLPSTDSSLASTPIGPGLWESTFKGQVDPAGITGYDRIHYQFRDHNNPADSVGITIEFFFDMVGVSENSNHSYLKFSNMVNNFTVMDYLLPSNVTKARIDINNMLGSRVQSITLDEKQGMKLVDTSGMRNGLYLVSLVVNDKVTHSYRMVVNHKSN